MRAAAPRRPKSGAELRRQAEIVLARLRGHYPDARCALNHRNPLELLIATILSAQCTDQRVNLVTKDLFRTYRSASDYAAAPLKELERAIQSTGFFRNKARNIQGCCQRLVDVHCGQVPKTMEELVELPGVGRKTANVVLGTAMGIAVGVVVDTHVTRLSHRLGLSRGKTAERIEQELMAVVPREGWIDFSHLLIHHGRAICVARKPRCEICPLVDLCPQVGVKSPASRKPIGGKRHDDPRSRGPLS